MKIITQTSTFKDVLSLVSQAVLKKATLPVLAHVLIQAKENNTVSLTGTDLETYFSVTFDAQVVEPGAICIASVPLVHAIQGSMKAQELRITTDEKLIKCRFNNFILPGLPVEEFPPAPMKDQSKVEIVKDSGWKLWTSEIYDTVSKVSYAKSDDQARPVLTGILLGLRDNAIVGTSTDGFRIVTNDFAVEPDPRDMVVCGKFIGIIEKEMKGKNNSVARVIFQEEKIGTAASKFVTILWRVKGKGFEANAALTVYITNDSAYPPFRLIVPKRTPFCMKMKRKELIDALESVKHLTAAAGTVPVAQLGIYNDHLIVYASAEGFGEVDMVVECSSNLPEVTIFPIALNAKFVVEALEADDGDLINMYFKYNNAPVVFHFSDTYKAVLMPMHLENNSLGGGLIFGFHYDNFDKLMKETIQEERRIREEEEAAAIVSI